MNNKLAEQVFREAHLQASNDEWSPQSNLSKDIDSIISGTHKTYRYILMTGLLAKATDPSINPLSLQAGSSLTGAYDARSLCHKVLVPLEREILNRSLGGSNEPFLNKPARFPEISLNNAVRKGKDFETLQTLHGVLTETTSQDIARVALVDAIYFALKRNDDLLKGLDAPLAERQNNRFDILEFLNGIIAQSIEGQTCALVAGTVLDLHYSSTSHDFETIVHPMNQSGASSKEISDVDIKKDGKIYLAIEVKDKDFTFEDVDHAAHKNAQAGLNSMLFVKGPRANPLNMTEEEMAVEIAAKGVDVLFVDLIGMSAELLSLTPSVETKNLMTTLLKHASHARVKDEVMSHIKNVYKQSNLTE